MTGGQSTNPYTAVVGNIYDGFTVVGPFDTLDEAVKFANSAKVPEEMTGIAMELVPPDEVTFPD